MAGNGAKVWFSERALAGPPGISLGVLRWIAAGRWGAAQATVSSMMPIALPAGMASTAIPAHAHNSHQACVMIASPPVMNAAVTTATSTQDEGLPCGLPRGNIPVFEPVRGPVPLPGSGVPGRPPARFPGCRAGAA